MSINTTNKLKTSDLDGATVMKAFHIISNVCKDVTGKNIPDLIDRELTEQIERSNAKIAELESEDRQYKASIRESNARVLNAERKNADLVGQERVIVLRLLAPSPVCTSPPRSPSSACR